MRSALLALPLAALIAAPALAQGLGLAAGGSDQPIQVEADQGIEWRRDQNLYVARGNARASRGGVTVHGDTLTARYRPKGESGSEIHQLEAEGNVRITSASETIVADRAVYDADQGVLVMTGKALKLTTRQDVITARDSLEYWEKRQLAVARGAAEAVRDKRRVKADVLSAQLAEGPGKEMKLRRVDAFGNVDVRTDQEVARGDKGVYLVDQGTATLIGGVRITRGQNQLNGEVAEVNLNTGVSRLLSGPQGSSRVRALVVPNREPQQPQQPPRPGTGG
jgi:lipopolysaccharide export system protein LptA